MWIKKFSSVFSEWLVLPSKLHQFPVRFFFKAAHACRAYMFYSKNIVVTAVFARLLQSPGVIAWPLCNMRCTVFQGWGEIWYKNTVNRCSVKALNLREDEAESEKISQQWGNHATYLSGRKITKSQKVSSLLRHGQKRMESVSGGNPSAQWTESRVRPVLISFRLECS